MKFTLFLLCCAFCLSVLAEEVSDSNSATILSGLDTLAEPHALPSSLSCVETKGSKGAGCSKKNLKDCVQSFNDVHRQIGIKSIILTTSRSMFGEYKRNFYWYGKTLRACESYCKDLYAPIITKKLPKHCMNSGTDQPRLINYLAVGRMSGYNCECRVQANAYPDHFWCEKW